MRQTAPITRRRSRSWTRVRDEGDNAVSGVGSRAVVPPHACRAPLIEPRVLIPSTQAADTLSEKDEYWMVRPTGFEPIFLAPEASALSIELRALHGKRKTRGYV